MLAFYLGGLVGSLDHRAAVAHAVCAEHGSPLHEVEPAAVEVAARLSGSPQLVGAAPSRADEHRHCALASFQHEATSTAGAPALSARREAAPLVAAVKTARRAPAVALYRLAPKTSPPSTRRFA